LSKKERSRSCFRRNDQNVSPGSHLAEDTHTTLIEEIVRKYRADFSNKKLLITFDATPRADDVLAVLFSVVDENFYIIDQLAALRLYASSLNGLEHYDVILDAMEKIWCEPKTGFFLQRGSWWGGTSHVCEIWASIANV